MSWANCAVWWTLRQNCKFVLLSCLFNTCLQERWHIASFNSLGSSFFPHFKPKTLLSCWAGHLLRNYVLYFCMLKHMSLHLANKPAVNSKKSTRTAPAAMIALVHFLFKIKKLRNAVTDARYLILWKISHMEANIAIFDNIQYRPMPNYFPHFFVVLHQGGEP